MARIKYNVFGFKCLLARVPIPTTVLLSTRKMTVFRFQRVRRQHSKAVRSALQPVHAERGDSQQHGQNSGVGVGAQGRPVHREQRAEENPRRRRGGREHQQHAAQGDERGRRRVAGKIARKIMTAVSRPHCVLRV